MGKTLTRVSLPAFFLSVAAVAMMALLFWAPLTAHAAQDSELLVASSELGSGVTLSEGQVSASNVDSSSSGSDILLAMFTTNLEDWTESFYGSYDGKTMYRVSTTRASKANKPYMTYHYALQCPSIMYHDGYFWAMSWWNRQNGRFWPEISYSKDLIHWTHPEADGMITGTRGIEVDEYPTVNGKTYKNFDVVAPEWSKASDGEIYITFSAGYYGEFHGHPTDDQMQAYTVKVTNLFALDGIDDGGNGYLWPNELMFETETAQKLSFSDYKGANFIDGQIFTDKGVDYLIIKKGGLTNQLYRTKDISKPNGWKLVNKSMTWGYEGGSMVKFKGRYNFYTDGVLGTKPLGVHMASSKSLTKKKSWGEPDDVMYLDENNRSLETRHGTVIVLKAGTEQWKVVKDLLDAQKRRESGVMHRLYNPNSGEHFYTADGLEAGNTQRAGWSYEGIAWYAPESSSKPVYRLYNKFAGDHHYTKSKAEYNSLAKKGWKKEGIAWYSSGKSGVPLYRAYNKNAKAGAHHYTTSKAEIKNLKKEGWKSEGIGWYGKK